uniref:Secreted protein n=1 Tax=Glossina austeni TaxID=7395 RepID=A0A1A9UU84_GLOAU
MPRRNLLILRELLLLLLLLLCAVEEDDEEPTSLALLEEEDDVDVVFNTTRRLLELKPDFCTFWLLLPPLLRFCVAACILRLLTTANDSGEGVRDSSRARLIGGRGGVGSGEANNISSSSNNKSSSS